MLGSRAQAIRQPSEMELELSPTQRKWMCVPCRILCPILSWRIARFVSWVTSFFKVSSHCTWFMSNS